MDIEHLLEQARRLEDVQAWSEALRLYLSVLEERERTDTPDPALHSRVGDLQVRMEDVESAVKSWERAIESYLLEGESDSALAVCRKIVRYSPEREEIYLRMGQIRARQGLLIYARKHFLTYAEMVGMRGDQAEALRAMEELVSWVPSDLETRLFLAERLTAEGRAEKALVYLREGYWRALWERNEEAMEQMRPRILELDPGADLGLLPPEERAATTGDPSATQQTGAGQARKAEGGVWARILDRELSRRKQSEEEARRAAEETRRREEEAARHREEEARQREVKARGPQEEPPSPEKAGAEEEDAAEPTPQVDLGGLILDAPGRSGEASPRSLEGEGASDFTQLLSRFKEKTAQRPNEAEARGHYDLGVANREMGLLDDAIVLFEKALEVDPTFLPAFEMLGRCHVEKGQPVAAIQKMGPGLELPVQVEDDLLGIYYYMGRACEDTGDVEKARDWYDRIFTLDINFLDVTDRIRALR